MSIRVYVAGASLEVERAERMIKRLRGCGIVVTSSWPEVVRLQGNNPRSAAPATRARWAHDDLLGVLSAELTLMLVPPVGTPTIGGWIEVGVAHRDGQTCVFAGDTKQTIFSAMGIEFESDEAAFAHVLKLGGVTDRSGHV